MILKERLISALSYGVVYVEGVRTKNSEGALLSQEVCRMHWLAHSLQTVSDSRKESLFLLNLVSFACSLDGAPEYCPP